MTDGPSCPDGGTCHHDCVDSCFRVSTCGPLSGVYENDEWPEEAKALRWMNVTDILRKYRPGSKDEPWSWRDEAIEMIGGPHWARSYALLLSVNQEGIKQPILLGNDGRVWDGHHRIVIAMLLNISLVPVELTDDEVA